MGATDRLTRAMVKAAVRTPAQLADRLFGPPPVNDRQAALDCQTHVFLQVLERMGSPELHELGPQGAREAYARASRILDLAPRPLHAVTDHRATGPSGAVAVRAYRPRPGRLPALVYYHGGGFVVGSVDVYDGVLRALAEWADAVVIGVDYRLAPEHPFPAAIVDCTAAYNWARRNADELGIDPQRIAVGGDSAGGNLATVVCQQLVEAELERPSHQLLIYPTTDNRGGYASMQTFAEGYFLSAELVSWFARSYLQERGRSHDPRVSPILFERLDLLPPAQIITAGFDPLRDQGEAYAERLEAAGVAVMHRCCNPLVHGFVTMGGVIDAARREVAAIADGLRSALHGGALGD